MAILSRISQLRSPYRRRDPDLAHTDNKIITNRSSIINYFDISVFFENVEYSMCTTEQIFNQNCDWLCTFLGSKKMVSAEQMRDAAILQAMQTAMQMNLAACLPTYILRGGNEIPQAWLDSYNASNKSLLGFQFVSPDDIAVHMDEFVASKGGIHQADSWVAAMIKKYPAPKMPDGF